MRLICRPPIGPAARNGGFVGNAESTPDAEKLERITGLQLAKQRRDRLDRRNEWSRLGNLRADVHLDAANDDVSHFGGPFINGRGVMERDAKFVFALAGRDILVRRRHDIRIYSERDWCALVSDGGDLIDVIKLSFAFDIERVNPLLQGIFDLFAGFPDSGESAFRGIAAGPDNAIEFATGNDVEPSICLREQTKNRAIRVGLDRIANEVIKADQGRIQSPVMIENRSRAVNIQRCSESLGSARKLDLFAKESAV